MRFEKYRQSKNEIVITLINEEFEIPEDELDLSINLEQSELRIMCLEELVIGESSLYKAIKEEEEI